MLTAVGIASTLEFDGWEYVVRVDEPSYEARARIWRATRRRACLFRRLLRRCD